MIVIDFSNIYHIALNESYTVKLNPQGEFNGTLVYHLVMNMIRGFMSRHGATYGSPVIACDGKFSWRKQVFPNYKAHRKKARQSLVHIDWSQAFALFDQILEDLSEYTSWPVIKVDGAEGDDVIAQLVIAHAHEEWLIVSRDHDFAQLQAYTRVSQWDPTDSGSMVKVPDGYKYLHEHIMRGDRGDGVPNILSDDDTFVTEGKRQRRLTDKRLSDLQSTAVSEWDDERLRANWERNRTLIDLRHTPEELTESILASFEAQQHKPTSRVFELLQLRKLTRLMDSLGDFRTG